MLSSCSPDGKLFLCFFDGLCSLLIHSHLLVVGKEVYNGDWLAVEHAYRKDTVNRLDIVLVDLDPTRGREIQKTRPCVVISPNIINHNAQTILIAAITHYDDDKAESPLFVSVPATKQTGLAKKSLVTTMRMRTIDRIRILKKLGMFPKQRLEELNYAIALGVGLENI